MLYSKEMKCLFLISALAGRKLFNVIWSRGFVKILKICNSTFADIHLTT